MSEGVTDAMVGLMGVAVMANVAGKMMKKNNLRIVKEPRHEKGHSIFHKSARHEERFARKGGKKIW